MKRPTRSDVARLAGVSVATVSYVINNGPRPVAEETRARVQAAIQELKYHPHAIARSLSKGKTQTIGFLVTSLIPSFVTYLVTAVENNLAHYGYGLILASSHEDCQREALMLNTLASQSIDGLLYIPTSCSNGNLVKDLIEKGLPVVLIDRYIPGLPADVVTSDNVQAGYHAARYLLRKGCRHNVLISFSDEASSALDRVSGFKKALQEEHIAFRDESILVVKYAIGDTVDVHLSAYINQYGMPDGFLCTSDTTFVETVKYLRTRGVRVPGQVHVTGGFFDSPWNEILTPPLPIVAQDIPRIAGRAVQYLMERMNDNTAAPRLDLVPVHYLHYES